MRPKKVASTASVISPVHTAPTLQAYMWQELSFLLQREPGLPIAPGSQKRARQVSPSLPMLLCDIDPPCEPTELGYGPCGLRK